MASATYGEVLARNIRAVRSRSNLGQESVVARMRALGYDTWHRQTMGKVERGERRITAEEVLGLSVAMETSIAALLMPDADAKQVTLPGGQVLGIAAIRFSVRAGHAVAVSWQGDQPVFPDPFAPLQGVIPQADQETFRTQVRDEVLDEVEALIRQRLGGPSDGTAGEEG